MNRAVVLRFRLHLESLGLAAGTVNQRLAPVRRLAYEAADFGLLSSELAAGIRRGKDGAAGGAGDQQAWRRRRHTIALIGYGGLLRTYERGTGVPPARCELGDQCGFKRNRSFLCKVTEQGDLLDAAIAKLLLNRK